MIDLSDGLGGDAGAPRRARAASRSGSTPAPCRWPQGVAEIAAAAGRDPLELAASGGEDYELLAALPPERLAAAAAAIGAAAEATLTQVGEVARRRGASRSGCPAGGLLAPTGFDQLG